MSVDRTNRDRLAVALAASLRGETTEPDLQAAARRIMDDIHGTTNGDKYLEVWLLTLAYYQESDSQTEKKAESASGYPDWLLRQRRRRLAFLKSDLQLRERTPRESPTLDDVFSLWALRWHTAVLALVFVFLITNGYWSWWLHYLAGAASMAVFLHCEKKTAAKARVVDFDPFADEGEWLEHEGLLNDLNVPVPEPEFEMRAAPRPFWQRISDWLVLPFAQPIIVPVLWIVGEWLRFRLAREELRAMRRDRERTPANS
jgi:hypothetical protein